MKVSVIGVGKLGLCFSLTLEKNGYDVLGLDVNPQYVESLNSRTFKSAEQGVNELLGSANNFKATLSLEDIIDHSSVLFVVVATPSLPNGRYDHSQVDGLVQSLKDLGPQKNNKELVICCTTMPGYCDQIQEQVKDLNYVVSYNPEFIAQGTILNDQAKPDMVLIGEGSEDSGDLLEEIYRNHTENDPRICRMSPLEAEVTKIALNCFLTTKIAYANMVGDIVRKAGGNQDKVLSAIGEDTRIGGKYLRYGYGYGGPCFPRDNRALALYAGDLGVEALISLASDASNKNHLQYQVEEYINTHNVNDPVSFDYITYKPESTLLEESQQLEFAVGIARHGFKVTIKERQEVVEELRNTYGDLFIYEVRT
tara:strand:+ start:193 stop:1293 length:1101 start_codon:yes stop_codon:yes gene_type:complete